jgi:hypothetical protein
VVAVGGGNSVSVSVTHPTAVTAETWAARRIKGALDTGAPVDVRAIADDSGLTVKEVRDLATRMTATQPAKPRPVPRPEPRQDAYTLPAEWLTHDVPAIRRLAARARDAIEACATAVAADAERATLRAKRARLVQELAAIDAQLKGGPAPASHVCGACGHTSPSAMGLKAHTTRSHKEAE